MRRNELYASLLVAVLLGLFTLAFPAHTQAQANAETVTIPVGGMT